MKINSPTDVPPVNGDDILNFTASVTSAMTDETPGDNVFELVQTVVNSFDPNDKTCLEGDTVGPEMIAEYVHYLIRFENTGTFAAENIAVTDMIDTAKFDINTVTPVAGSHPFETRIGSAGKVEFIFQNINLPFDDANNDGFVAFKIKTLSTLQIGNTFTNEAGIYFDYNFPILTNTASTTIQILGISDIEFGRYFTIFPNPGKDLLYIRSAEGINPSSTTFYNALGQLVLRTTGWNEAIDISHLNAGTYFIKIGSDKGSAVSKIIKK